MCCHSTCIINQADDGKNKMTHADLTAQCSAKHTTCRGYTSLGQPSPWLRRGKWVFLVIINILMESSHIPWSFFYVISRINIRQNVHTSAWANKHIKYTQEWTSSKTGSLICFTLMSSTINPQTNTQDHDN